MFEKIHIIITLVATAIVALFSYIFFESLVKAAIGLIITIIVFFALGLIFKSVVDKGFEEMEKRRADEKLLTDADEEEAAETGE